MKDAKIWYKKNENNITSTFHNIIQERYNTTDDIKNFKGYLIYGRRDEINSNRIRKERWQSLSSSLSKDIEVMSYDRIKSNIEFDFHSPLEVLSLFGSLKRLKLYSYRQREFIKKEVE